MQTRLTHEAAAQQENEIIQFCHNSQAASRMSDAEKRRFTNAVLDFLFPDLEDWHVPVTVAELTDAITTAEGMHYIAEAR